MKDESSIYIILYPLISGSFPKVQGLQKKTSTQRYPRGRRTCFLPTGGSKIRLCDQALPLGQRATKKLSLWWTTIAARVKNHDGIGLLRSPPAIKKGILHSDSAIMCYHHGNQLRADAGYKNARRLKQGIHSLVHRMSYAFGAISFRKSSGFQPLPWNTRKFQHGRNMTIDSSVAGVLAPGYRSGGRQCSRMLNHTP